MNFRYLAKVRLASGRVWRFPAADLAFAEKWVSNVTERHAWQWSSISERGFLIRWAQAVEVRS